VIPLADVNARSRGTPYVNIGLIVINTIVFVYTLFLNDFDQQLFFFKYGLIPRELTAGINFTDIETTFGERLNIDSHMPAWGTVFTSMFIHGGVLHCLGNMVFLWVFGDNVEDRLGHVKYLVFYLLAGIAAMWTQVAINMDSEVPNIGASGAIAGVLGAYLLLYPFHQVRTAVVFLFIVIVRMPAIYLLGFWIILQLFSGVGSLDPAIESGVAYWAHIGGFAAGVLAIAVLKLAFWREPLWPRRQPPADFWQVSR
jgi:membrane associated rhomboid family serine protease